MIFEGVGDKVRHRFFFNLRKRPGAMLWIQIKENIISVPWSYKYLHKNSLVLYYVVLISFCYEKLALRYRDRYTSIKKCRISQHRIDIHLMLHRQQWTKKCVCVRSLAWRGGCKYRGKNLEVFVISTIMVLSILKTIQTILICWLVRARK